MSFDKGRLAQVCYWTLLSEAAQRRHVKGYRCYLMSGGNIQAVQIFECANDAEVILKANELLASKPQHPAVEIWEGKRFVARLASNSATDSGQHGSANVVRVVKQRDD